MVDISSLSVPIVGTRQIAGILASTKLLDPRPPAVIEHPDAHTGEIDPQRTDDRAGEDRLLLVIGGNQHVHSWSALQPGEPRTRLGRLATAVDGASKCNIGDGRSDGGRGFN